MSETFKGDCLYQIENVSKTYVYGEDPALVVPELAIPHNRVVVILGNSGSGKTTLINILGMLDYPDRLFHGSTDKRPNIYFNGFGPSKSSLNMLSERAKFEKKRRETFGFVFQEGYLLSNMSNKINVEVPVFINGADINSNRIDDLFEKMDLDKKLSRRLPSALSGGQAQRIAIIRSMIHRPKVIIADEPSSSLQHHLGMQVMENLAEWCHSDGNRTLIWVTHNVEQASKLGDHLIILRDGRVVHNMPNPKNSDIVLKAMQQQIDPTLIGVMVRKDHADLQSQESIQKKITVPSIEKQEELNNPLSEKRKSTFRRMIKFSFLFAFSNFFPSVRNNKSWSPLQKLFGRRNAQNLNVLTLFTVILFGLFFLNISYSLKNYFVTSISDPRINKIIVNGKKNGSELHKEDITKLTAIGWGKEGSSWIIKPVKQKIFNKTEPGKLSKVNLGVFGSRDRGLDAYISKEDRSNTYSSLFPLSEIILNVNDPILTRDYLLEGDTVDSLRPTQRSIQTAFMTPRGGLEPDKRGVIITKEALSKHLGYKNVPAEIDVDFMSQRRSLPVLGIAESLPFFGDVMVTEGWYEKHFFELGSKQDQIPGYQRISVYIKDMLKDGIPMCDAIKKMGFVTNEDVRARLNWIKNLTDFVMLFSVLASLGILFVACGTLFSSYAQSVKKKQKEIGVLLAYGIRKFYLYLVFLVEVTLVLSFAVILVLFGQNFINWLLKIYMSQKLQLGDKFNHIFELPSFAWWAVIIVTAVMACISVFVAVRQIIKKDAASILKTSL